MDIWTLIAKVGAPIAAALVMGGFIFIIMRQMVESVVASVNTLKMFTESLITRVKTINNDMIKLDLLISHALKLRPDEDRISRADGKIDARKD